MKRILSLYLCFLSLAACDVTPVGPVEELSRSYCPDSSRYLLFYHRQQGAWDGDRACLATVMKAGDSIKTTEKPPSVVIYYLDSAYWKKNDSLVILEKYTEYIHKGQPSSRDTMIKGVNVQIQLITPPLP